MSGGECQRIALARALYRKPEILILDEFTAALDAESEQEMIKLVFSIRDQGMTLVVISHRLQIVRQADHIILISSGKIAESGQHNELYRSGGLYRKFWEQQNGA